MYFALLLTYLSISDWVFNLSIILSIDIDQSCHRTTWDLNLNQRKTFRFGSQRFIRWATVAQQNPQFVSNYTKLKNPYYSVKLPTLPVSLEGLLRSPMLSHWVRVPLGGPSALYCDSRAPTLTLLKWPNIPHAKNLTGQFFPNENSNKKGQSSIIYLNRDNRKNKQSEILFKVHVFLMNLKSWR